MQLGVSIAAVALHYRMNANLLRRWLKAHEERSAALAPQYFPRISLSNSMSRSLGILDRHGTFRRRHEEALPR
ncbi:hypothetical protein LMG28138_04519 [Pararobbsia alpina]|uniref:Transposase n=2 Tax=Pararobbsia alpina TaxID=621374 RepID=A0A6S7CVK1_9BURK|nr:hypothetical protein LMG28138_04519 [Pararobbsia alpina]